MLRATDYAEKKLGLEPGEAEKEELKGMIPRLVVVDKKKE